MARIDTGGILISVFIGFVLGLKMQDNYLWVQPKPTENALQAIASTDVVQAKNITKERLVEELKKYMTSNFGYQSLKVSWIQYIKDYDIFFENEGVMIQVQTHLLETSGDLVYMLNAVQGFVKSRLPDMYEQSRVVIINQKGDILMERKFSAS
ncbi:hypothetical protein [Aneurinibacillus thermoaerophilus]|uniref:GerMN domain-containing protein n=2 Tax=Aneurinibacillus thermoaerophilus TaxID=143495 RepID=A0ABX8YDH4_ANETH|nr:hypothetical protein [Aneurinibacillus thermoaerophilus]MED0678188.1 hypothetical protein [Aneurinibacillus thermoaerophilus]MED0737625.1 hypothetical protein [Aneurinibacillus thermoaerophilus]MED0765667.1 hypothetical protein [Aneurinibacillus thermoaerophilus]QYY43415.1 hypothetical protein K3F53_03960 [Aneurinibacillus thermoaerophilus]